MSSPDGYEDNMGRFLRFSDEELARLLAGEAGVGDEASADVASLLADARTSFAVAPDAATRARHIAAISEASQVLAENGNPVARPVGDVDRSVGAPASALPKWRRAITMTKSLVLRAAGATLAASMSMVGLAYAGVDLPGGASAKAVESVLGVELPNQNNGGVVAEAPDSESADVAQELWNYITTTEDTGCVFGQNVAAIASGSDPTPDHDPCSKGDESDEGDEVDEGDNGKGAEKSAEGKARGEEGKAKGAEKSAEGQANGEEGKAKGAEKSAEGQSNKPTGDDADSGDDKDSDSGDDSDTDEDTDSDDDTNPGDGAAEEGQSNNPTENGRP